MQALASLLFLLAISSWHVSHPSSRVHDSLLNLQLPQERGNRLIRKVQGLHHTQRMSATPTRPIPNQRSCCISKMIAKSIELNDVLQFVLRDRFERCALAISGGSFRRMLDKFFLLGGGRGGGVASLLPYNNNNWWIYM